MQELGERIRAERVMWGMTQEELAEAAGISRDKIAKIETGRRQVDADELPTLARAFSLSIEELVQGPPVVTYHRYEAGRGEDDAARAWLAQCIDNSLFVRRVLAADAR